MSLFSNCWDCWTCRVMECCYVGNGDDDYCPATIEQILDRLSKHKYVGDPQTISEKFDYNRIQEERQHMIDFLKSEYNFEYEVN